MQSVATAALTGVLNRQTHEQLAPIINNISRLIDICDAIKKVIYHVEFNKFINLDELNSKAAGIINMTPREVIKKNWPNVDKIFDKNSMSLEDWKKLCLDLPGAYKTLEETKNERTGFSTVKFFFGSSGQASRAYQAKKVDATARSQAKKAPDSSTAPLLHVEEVDSLAVSPFKEGLTGQSDAANPLSLKQSYQPNLLSGLDAAVVTGGLSTLVMTSAMLILDAQVDA